MNKMIQVSIVSELLRSDLRSTLWQPRLNILKGIAALTTSQPTAGFLKDYARRMGTCSVVPNGTHNYMQKPIKNTCIMYSGGAESVLLSSMYTGVDLINVTEWLEYDDLLLRREFQLAMLGMMLGYSTTIIGIEDPDPATEGMQPNLYEWSTGFVSDWNKHFKPYGYTIQYPIVMRRDEVYKTLLRKGLDWNSCDSLIDGAACTKCYKCAERFFIEQALNVPVSRWPNAEALAEFQRTNGEFKKAGTDPYGSMAFLYELERDYGYTGGWTI